MVFGIGSYTYQANTRDTFGTAIKATWVLIDGVPTPIFKDPKTDDGTKKSAKGLLQVIEVEGKLILRDEVTPGEERAGLLKTVYLNGEEHNSQTLGQIRERIARNVHRS